MATLFKKKRKRSSKNTSPPLQDIVADNNNNDINNNNNNNKRKEHMSVVSPWASFDDLGLAPPLVATCRQLGFTKPTPVQRTLVPFLLSNDAAHVLALASTGSGKTAAFVLPILHRLQADPYGIYAVVLTPTRELAKQIHQQVLALGSAYRVQSALVVGGLDAIRQSCALDRKPHFVVATPGRLAELLRGPQPPRIQHTRFLVLDEADRLLANHNNSGFEKDVAELLVHCTQHRHRKKCQTLLLSATMTKSLQNVEEIAGAGKGRLPLHKFVIRDDGPQIQSKKKKKKKKSKTDADTETEEPKESTNDQEEDDEDDHDETDEEEEEELSTKPQIPAGLKQEYIFMPSRVRDAYLLTTLRALMVNGGRRGNPEEDGLQGSGWNSMPHQRNDDDDDDDESGKARSAIVFVGTCERAGLISGILSEVGVENVALHSLLSQNRRLAALGKFKSQQVRLLVATDVASRGLDIPSVDLVVNAELPRNAVCYVHRVGRTARAGRRGRAISLVAETDVALVHAVEQFTTRPLLKCTDVTDDMALKLLGPVTRAARLAKMKLMDIGFDQLVQKMKERKVRDRQERERIARKLNKKVPKVEH